MEAKRFWLQLLGYGVLLAVVLVCLQLLRYSFLLGDGSVEIYLLLAGVPLLAAGVIAGRWISARTEARALPRAPDSPLTARELEILDQVSQGLSNQEIADQLFLSLSTVKTHLQSIYTKLEVKRRTQAVDRARRLELIS